jgi:hypothetical protein
LGGVRAWAAKRIGALVKSLKPPDVALNVVSLRGGDLYATLTGEAVPRHVQNIDMKLRFGRDYHSLTLDLTGVQKRLLILLGSQKKQSKQGGTPCIHLVYLHSSNYT